MPGTASGESLFPVLKNEARAIRTALWFRPTAYCLLAVIVAVLVATVDGFLPRDALAWLPQIDSASVEDLLKLLAGSMLTVATVTLSVLMLVLSLAAGQASPRAVPEVMADPVTQNALGTFLATFVFALTALLLLGFDAVNRPGVTLIFCCALLLVMNSVRYLVQWIHHVADSLKLNRIVHRIHRQARAVLESYLNSEPEAACESVTPRAGDEREICSESTGYIQLIDGERLHALACEHDLVVRLAAEEGDFVHPRRRLMTLCGAPVDDDTVAALRATVVVGFERSHAGDPRLGFELLAEIASRALSSGINDPQSALVCIAYLGSLLSLAGERGRADYPADRTPDGRIRFRRADFGALMERAIRPVARDGASSAEVLCAMMESLIELAGRAHADHLETIVQEAQRVADFGAEGLTLEVDRQKLRDMMQQLHEVAAQRRGAPDSRAAAETS